jgi:toxin ParE1/3/4
MTSWLDIANDRGSFDVADRVVDNFTHHFFLISRHPKMGRSRDELRAGYRSFPVGQYLILYRVGEKAVEIMHVLHGRRDLRSIIE